MFKLGNYQPKEKLEFDGYIIRKLTAEDIDIDYAACMSSIDTIHQQRGGTWPTLATKEEDFRDLKQHQREFDSRTSFAYIVTNKEGDESFGCIYFYPVGHPFNSAEPHTPVGTDAIINMWVTQKAFNEGLYDKLYRFVERWTKDDWPFKKPYFSNPLKPSKDPGIKGSKSNMNIIKTKSFEIAIYAKGDVNAEKLALVLPGRLDTKDYAHTSSLVDTLADKGYYALSLDPPGIWESPGSFDLYTTTNYLKVVSELIDYFGNRPTTLLGFSRGGSVAMLTCDNPAVEAIVCINATYGEPTPPLPDTEKLGYEKVMQDIPPGTSRLPDRPQREFKLPLNYFVDGNKYNPGEALKHCHKPKLLIYATNDRYTPVSEVKELYQAVPDPKAIHEIDSPHNYRTYPELIAEVNDVISNFLEQHFDI